MNNSEKLIEVIKRVFGEEANLIQANTPRQKISSWDSFRGLVFVSELEREFGVTFTVADIDTMQTLENIKERLGFYGINLS